MREIPECLNRRYQILDKLIKDLSTSPPPGESAVPQPSAASNEVGVKLMCDFWNILKEDPECDLPAASFDKKCHVRVEELMSTQRDLMVQIQNLEKREKQGVQLLKQADCMWSCMEESYKKKISQSQERYKALMTELKEIETSAIKWKKHKKDLEFQLTNINQCGDDIKEKTYQKNNDLKVMNMEIEELKKRIASNAKDLNVAKNSYKAKKEASDMDPETYKQLMLCLKDVTVTRPVKEDKGTGSKKEPCHRWGGISECHCPKGPKACVCSKAPHPPTDPPSCGLQPAEEDPAEKSCPQRESLACSTDCGMLGMPGAPSNWRREPCAGQSCPFSKNMRAAQCVLGPEPLSSEPKAHSLPPNTPKKLPEDKTLKKLAEDKTVKKLPEDKTVKKLPEDKMATCACGSKAVKPCPCNRGLDFVWEYNSVKLDIPVVTLKSMIVDRRGQPRQRIFEEVMGRYSEVSPIQNISFTCLDNESSNISYEMCE
ncbi:unnamed protein product [Spodoptera exigua]|nr:unnamed protein product [Spodoptera exigua]